MQSEIFKDIIKCAASNIKKKNKNAEQEMQIMELLFSDDSDNGDTDLIYKLLGDEAKLIPCERMHKTYEENFYESAVPKFSEDEFGLHFRMQTSSFEILVSKLEPHITIPLVDPSKAVMFTVFMLGHGDNIRLGSHKFGFPPTSGYRFYKMIVKAIVQLLPEYIKWPSCAQRKSIASRFESTCGIPGIVGSIDGCHILLKQPPGNAIDYYNRKQFHAILLQGTCDDKMRFIDVEIGHPGRVHDARMFSESELGKKLATMPSDLLSANEHILGDCAYPNSEYVVTPFKNNGRLTQQKISFNIRVCSGRSIIENSFGQLKGKFRRLKYLDMGDLEFVEQIIAASCVLHNFIIIHKDNSPTADPFIESEPSSDEEYDGSSFEDINSFSKREKLMNLLEGSAPLRKRRRKP